MAVPGYVSPYCGPDCPVCDKGGHAKPKHAVARDAAFAACRRALTMWEKLDDTTSTCDYVRLHPHCIAANRAARTMMNRAQGKEKV